MDDAQILQMFAQSRSQEAFAHLVARRVHVVYSACLRQLRDPVRADQATQAVFVLLARQAARLKAQASLVPWLFDTAQEVCCLFARTAGAPNDDQASSSSLSPVYAAPAPVYVAPAYTYPYAYPYAYPPVGISLNLGYSRGWGGYYHGYRGWGGYRGWHR